MIRIEAVHRADAIYGDVWVSMGDEASAGQRRADLAPYRIDGPSAFARQAGDDCDALPAGPSRRGDHRDVLYGDRSAVWDQAENRLHAQKALLEYLLAP